MYDLTPDDVVKIEKQLREASIKEALAPCSYWVEHPTNHLDEVEVIDPEHDWFHEPDTDSFHCAKCAANIDAVDFPESLRANLK